MLFPFYLCPITNIQEKEKVLKSTSDCGAIFLNIQDTLQDTQNNDSEYKES